MRREYRTHAKKQAIWAVRHENRAVDRYAPVVQTSTISCICTTFVLSDDLR